MKPQTSNYYFQKKNQLWPLKTHRPYSGRSGILYSQYILYKHLVYKHIVYNHIVYNHIVYNHIVYNHSWSVPSP